MPSDVALVLVLLTAVVGVVVLSQRFRLPHPIVLVLAGLVFGLIPGVPEVRLDPEVVLVIFLPPLLFSAAWDTSWRDFRADITPISLLAIGLVLATTVAVAAVAHAIVPGLGWPAAFVIGAVLSPTDPVSAVSIASRLGAPRRLVTIIEGEGLVNDATALVVYSFAVTAATTGDFSLGIASATFVGVFAGSCALGLVAGWVTVQVMRRVDDASVEVTILLISPFVAYLAADALSMSGPLAVVVTGLYVSHRRASFMAPSTRLQASAVWNVGVFVLNGLLFILVGLEVRPVIESVQDQPLIQLTEEALAITLTVVVIRFVWVLVGTSLLQLVRRSGEVVGSWRTRTVIAWSGLRGAISLAAALALPLTVDGGDVFDPRDLIVFVTYVVVVVTLVGQGLTLRPLIGALGIEGGDVEERERRHGRVAVNEAALRRIDELDTADWASGAQLDRLRGHFEERLAEQRAESEDTDAHPDQDRSRVLHDVIQAQRDALVDLRDRGEISDRVAQRLERDLDLREARLGPPS